MAHDMLTPQGGLFGQAKTCLDVRVAGLKRGPARQILLQRRPTTAFMSVIFPQRLFWLSITFAETSNELLGKSIVLRCVFRGLVSNTRHPDAQDNMMIRHGLIAG